MALLDRYTELAGPSAVNEVRLLGAQLASEAAVSDSPGLYRTFGFSDDEVESLASSLTPTGGIYGVGLWQLNNQEFQPAVFTVGSPGLTRPEVVPIEDSPVSLLISGRIGYRPTRTLAVVFPPHMPQQAVSPGDDIACMGSSGTLGIPVWASDGSRAFTTAGHVGSSVAAQVLAGGSQVGLVSQTDSPANHAQGDECADLAIITLHPSVGDTPHGFTGVATGAQFENIESVTRQGPQVGWVRGVSDNWGDTPTTGTWGDVLITDHAISQPGDSGAPCHRDGWIVGTIVAGAVPAYSLVQDIQYQLTKANIKARL